MISPNIEPAKQEGGGLWKRLGNENRRRCHSRIALMPRYQYEQLPGMRSMLECVKSCDTSHMGDERAPGLERKTNGMTSDRACGKADGTWH